MALFLVKNVIPRKRFYIRYITLVQLIYELARLAIRNLYEKNAFLLKTQFQVCLQYNNGLNNFVAIWLLSRT